MVSRPVICLVVLGAIFFSVPQGIRWIGLRTTVNTGVAAAKKGAELASSAASGVKEFVLANVPEAEPDPMQQLVEATAANAQAISALTQVVAAKGQPQPAKAAKAAKATKPAPPSGEAQEPSGSELIWTGPAGTAVFRFSSK